MTEERKDMLSAEQISIHLKMGKNVIPMVRRISLTVAKGGCTGIIGESGCGKSMTCQALLGMLNPRKWLVEGRVLLDGAPVPIGDDTAMDHFRGSQMGLILQNPGGAFDPRMTVGAHFCMGYPRRERRRRLEETACQLSRMYIHQPTVVLDSYPFQLSGGMLQRILIALAIGSRPKLLIADEPTTALDSTTQSEILRILQLLQQEDHISILLVSHDLEVVSSLADRVFVMYAGQVVEFGPKELVLGQPLHPYTRGLLRSRPAFSKTRMETMEGRPPRLGESEGNTGEFGCPFAPRCSYLQPGCPVEPHPLQDMKLGHWSRCAQGRQ